MMAESSRTSIVPRGFESTAHPIFFAYQPPRFKSRKGSQTPTLETVEFFDEPCNLSETENSPDHEQSIDDREVLDDVVAPPSQEGAVIAEHVLKKETNKAVAVDKSEEKEGEEMQGVFSGKLLDDTCAICISPMLEPITLCGCASGGVPHSFCRACLLAWFRHLAPRPPTCPTCKRPGHYFVQGHGTCDDKSTPSSPTKHKKKKISRKRRRRAAFQGTSLVAVNMQRPYKPPDIDKIKIAIQVQRALHTKEPLQAPSTLIPVKPGPNNSTNGPKMQDLSSTATTSAPKRPTTEEISRAENLFGNVIHPNKRGRVVCLRHIKKTSATSESSPPPEKKVNTGGQFKDVHWHTTQAQSLVQRDAETSILWKKRESSIPGRMKANDRGGTQFHHSSLFHHHRMRDGEEGGGRSGGDPPLCITKKKLGMQDVLASQNSGPHDNKANVFDGTNNNNGSGNSSITTVAFVVEDGNGLKNDDRQVPNLRDDDKNVPNKLPWWCSEYDIIEQHEHKNETAAAPTKGGGVQEEMNKNVVKERKEEMK